MPDCIYILYFFLIRVFFPSYFQYFWRIENDDALIYHLKDLNLEFTWPVSKIKEVLPDQGSHAASSPLSCSFEATKAIASLVEEQNIPEAKIGLAAGVSAFLWLYTSIHGYSFKHY